jgi:hypothetical protein
MCACLQVVMRDRLTQVGAADLESWASRAPFLPLPAPRDARSARPNAPLRCAQKPRGFGFVTFKEEGAAEKACMDPHTIDGRTVRSRHA